MCEYCGCQALESISRLTAEHDDVVDLIGRAGAAVSSGDLVAAAAHARRIAAVLGPHTVVEEQGLFPALADEFPDHVRRLLWQHREIEAVLLEPERAALGDPDGPPPNDWGPRLVVTLRSLREHILAEQDGVFPAALAVLGPTQWAAVEAVREQVGTAAADASHRARE